MGFHGIEGNHHKKTVHHDPAGHHSSSRLTHAPSLRIVWLRQGPADKNGRHSHFWVHAPSIASNMFIYSEGFWIVRSMSCAPFFSDNDNTIRSPTLSNAAIRFQTVTRNASTPVQLTQLQPIPLPRRLRINGDAPENAGPMRDRESIGLTELGGEKWLQNTAC